MKKWLSVAVAVVLSLALVIGIACGDGEDEEEGVKTLKYGCGVPLTGFTASVGLATKCCMELAAEDIGVFEVGGEKYRWKCVYEDNKITTEGGYASANKFLYEHHVDFMFQATPESGLAAAMITEEVPMLLHIGPAGMYQVADLPHTFLTNLVWELTYPCLVDWVLKENPEVKVICTTYDESPSGLSGKDTWEAVCELHGLEHHTTIAPAGTVEWYPIATKLWEYEPDLIVSGGFSAGLMGAMWDFGYDGFVVTNWWEGESMAKWQGWEKLAEKNRFGKGFIVFGLHPFAGAFPELEAFVDEYERRSGMEFGVSASHIMNNLYILTQALQQAGTVDDLDKIIEAHETGTFDTLVGEMHFGLGEIVGIPHVGVWPVPIFEVVGPNDYLLHKLYTTDEVEALTLEAFEAK